MPRPKRERSEYFVGLNGQAIPVSREVYHAWYSGERREKYQKERDAHFKVSLFSGMNREENEDILEVIPSAEEDIQTAAERRDSYRMLYGAIDKLTEKEQKLIRQIYFEGMTKTQVAQQEAVCESSIRKREQRALSHLKKFF